MALAPEDVQLFQDATTLVEANKLEEAVSKYQQFNERAPFLVCGFLNMGVALERLGRLQEADAAYKSAIDTSKTDKVRGAAAVCLVLPLTHTHTHKSVVLYLPPPPPSSMPAFPPEFETSFKKGWLESRRIVCRLRFRLVVCSHTGARGLRSVPR